MITQTSMPKIFQKKCEYCGKVMSSLSEQQCYWNYAIHKDSCRKKEIKKICEALKDDRDTKKHKIIKNCKEEKQDDKHKRIC
jgi:hypothetical protein